MRVLHIDTEMTWRGGENQLRLLIEGAADQATWYLAAPAQSEVARRLNGKAKLFPIERSSIKALLTIPRLARYCRTQGIQIVDCQSSKAHSIGLLLKKLVPELKLVVHRRVDFAAASGLMSRRKYLSPDVDAYIAISQAIARIMEDAGIAAHKTHVVRSAVDPEAFAAMDRQQARQRLTQELELAEDCRIICNVGYHTAQKDQITLIRAVARLAQDQKNFAVLLAGDGPLRDKLVSSASELGVQQYIHFLGIRQDVPELLAASDIFVMPSAHEGLGTSILDAIHSGCAVAACEVGGIPEIILHQKTGLLSPVRDAERLSQNLAKLLKDETLRRSLITNAKAHIAQEFSLTQMVNGNLAVYRSLLASAARRKHLS